MFTFSFEDKIKFTKAVYYHFHKIPLPKPFKDGTGGMGKFAPEQGCIELYDQEGACAHLSVGPGFITDILPMILNGVEKQSLLEDKKRRISKREGCGSGTVRPDDAGYPGSESQ